MNELSQNSHLKGIREWSEEWCRCSSREALEVKLKEAKRCYKHASWMGQKTAELIWEARIDTIESELRNRSRADKETA